jgi:hypothetical protein
MELKVWERRAWKMEHKAWKMGDGVSMDRMILKNMFFEIAIGLK